MTEGLDRISSRLRDLAAELETEADEERVAELVREASELAAQAGQAVEEALRSGTAETPRS